MKIALYIVVIILTFIVVGGVFLLISPQFGSKTKGKYLERIKKSPTYTGEHFENSPAVHQKIGFFAGLKIVFDMLWGKEQTTPKEKLPSHHVTFNKETGNYLTWFGHSTFLYETNGKKILFDPMLGKYASPIPGLVKRYNYELPEKAEDLPFLDAVIISHDHYDHLDYGTVRILKDKVGVFISPLGVGAHLRSWGIEDAKIIELDWHEATTIGTSSEAITITSVPSQHFSGRSVNDTQASLWSAFIINNKDAKVFFGGDSGYFQGFKDIGEKYGPFDLTLLDSGQYDKRWSVVHMLPEQSVQAHKELQGKVFMPIHWSAFTLALHSWKDPAERALSAAEKENVDIITPMIGERFDVLQERPTKKWWRDLK